MPDTDTQNSPWHWTPTLQMRFSPCKDPLYRWSSLLKYAFMSKSGIFNSKKLKIVQCPMSSIKYSSQGKPKPLNEILTLEPFPKLLTLTVFWGPFGTQCSYGLPIQEYVTYLATDVTLRPPGGGVWMPIFTFQVDPHFRKCMVLAL